MNATLARKLRFSDAVYAINTTPKALRNWLQRGLVKIHTPQQEGGWTEYSFIDIAILALVRQLVNFGVDVPTASAIANEVMTAFFPKLLNVKEPEKMPAGALAMMWVNRRLYVYPSDDGDKWDMRCVALWESNLGRRAALAKALPDSDDAGFADFDPGLPSGMALVRKELEPAPVFLSIDVETVFRTAFERADESVNEGKVEVDE
jgi:hypothetical protein